MAFKQLLQTKAGRRLRRWSLTGFPGVGKSTFSARLRTPILPINVDSRYAEVAHLADGPVLALSDDPADDTDVRKIDELLAQNMPGAQVGTIVVDSLTSIYQHVTRRARVDEHNGDGPTNKSAAHAEKADVMALLATSITNWATDVLFIWHYNNSQQGRDVTVTQTISEIERARLRKFLSAELGLVVDPKTDRRGIEILWSRTGFGQGEIIWESDENLAAGTYWLGVPEQIDAKLLGAPAPAPRTEPLRFANADAAIEWGVKELGLDQPEVAKLYADLKAQKAPASAKQMFSLWEQDVQARKAELVNSAADLKDKDF